MTSLPEQLRQETRPLHEQTEQLFYTESLKNGTLSVSEYTHLLRTHLVFHKALEEAIRQHPAFFQAYDLPMRTKTAWLSSDLAKLGEQLPASMPGLFENWSPTALLGAAYVSEGSMLGATIIWKLLQQNSAIKPFISEARFYSGYGPQTGANWKQFGTFLSQQGASEPDHVVEAAKHAFIAYQTIFHYVQPA